MTRTGRFLAGALVGLAGVPVWGQPQQNLVINGSFEQLAGNLPVGWKCMGDSGVKQVLAADRGRAGGRSARLTCLSYQWRSPASHAMLAQVGKIAVKRGQWYRFSCWARAEGIASRRVTVALVDMSVWARAGLQMDLRVVPPESYGAALSYFTGSKEHNVHLRGLAQSKGLKLSEYGLSLIHI